MKAPPVVPIVLIQTFLCLAHWLMYRTWIDFWWPMSAPAVLALRIALGLLSVIFLIATFLGFRFSNPAVSVLYWAASLWLGLANYLFIGTGVAWLADLILRFTVPATLRLADRPYIAGGLVLISIVAVAYGVVNALLVRVRRVTVELQNLPASWHGRQAVLISDMHLGHINGLGFAQRIVAAARELNPAILFLAGDVFDGTKVDPRRVTAPFAALNPPLGAFFVGGNHEEFGETAQFETALREVGLRVLHNECVDVDGVRVVGVPYRQSTHPTHLRTFLEGLHLKNGGPSILLNHVPSRLPLAEQAGVSLQLSGHTHGGGQFFPFNLITRRAFGDYTYGLHPFGEMQVYTSSGAGTWGPPMRIGTHSEIVLLTFA